MLYSIGLSSKAWSLFPKVPSFNTSLSALLSNNETIFPSSLNLILKKSFSASFSFRDTFSTSLLVDSIILKLLYPFAGIPLAKKIAFSPSSIIWQIISSSPSNTAGFSISSGTSKVAISSLSNPRELNTTTLLSFKFISDVILSKADPTKLFPFSIKSLYSSLVTS